MQELGLRLRKVPGVGLGFRVRALQFVDHLPVSSEA